MNTWKEILGRLAVVEWKAEPVSTESRMPALVNAQVVSIGGRPRGVVDGVAAALVAHNSDAARLLVAVNDLLIAAFEALKNTTDPHVKTQVLAQLIAELNDHVLRDTGAWVKGYDEVQRACDKHDAIALDVATKNQRPH